MEEKKAKVLEVKKRNKFLEIWKRFRRNKTALVGLGILLVFIFFAIFADVICDYETLVIKQNARLRLQPPSSEHILGTDHFGRDIFARMIHGSRVSLAVSITVVIIAANIGGFIGAFSALVGGKYDNFIMRIIDTFSCIPAMLLTLTMVAALGPGIFNLMIAMLVNYTFGFARVTRAAVLSIVGQEFIESARSYGTSTIRIVFKHVMPNAVGIIIINGTLSIAGVILGIAGLSFLGMGIQPPSPEWGAMLNEGRAVMRTFPYLTVFPGIAIATAALSLNLIGDGLRDSLDPKLRD